MPSARTRQLPDWQRAHGHPLFQGLIKQTCGDFRVTELPGFARSGDGEHDYLWIEKEGANTAWVARALAAHAGVASRDVGYAGLKDRHAVTRQWFSVRRPTGAGTDWENFDLAGVRILETGRHLRKLKRGAHAGNEFRIAVRRANVPGNRVSERLETIRREGVPNYFGEQRFGRDGNNLKLTNDLFGGKRLKRETRSIALSAARSFLFNEILSSRVADGSWDQATAGEALNLDGTGSFFPAEEIDADLRARLQSMDLHSTGALWGEGKPLCEGKSAVIEREIANRHPNLAQGLERAGLSMDRRPLRLAVSDLSWEIGDGALLLEFRLGRGSYATSVLREIANIHEE